MDINDLIENFSDTTENQQKAIFNSLFIIGNRLQTLFDNHIAEISLKQFMLLSIVRNSKETLTFTQLGNLLGCSRQNIKKLAYVLEQKGFVNIEQSPYDIRALCVNPTEKAEQYWKNEFSKYEKELTYLFEVYSEEEIPVLFSLLMKLYAGIDNLDRRIDDEKV